MLAAHFYDGKSSRRQAAVLRLSQGRLYLAGDWGMREAGLGEVEISEPMGSAPRTLRFADGAYCEVADTHAFAALLDAAGHREPISVRLHKRWSVVVGAMLSIVALVIASYIWLLPALADFVAPRLPAAFSAQLSKASLDSLDRHILQPSALPPQRELALRRQMADFASASKLPAYTLHFRTARDMPPNAFALPSGDIVILDSLLAILDDEEALAVFAHELGHVEHQHGLRMLIQSAVVSTAAAVYLGDISSLAAALATATLQANYSQAFENEADRYAAVALKRNRRSPLALARALEKLEAAAQTEHKPTPDNSEQVPKEPASNFGRWLSSHPSIAERVALLQAQAGKGAD